MTRLWGGGVAIKVATQAEQSPSQFSWGGKLHKVEVIAEHWRLDVHWWRLRVWRDYYKLTTDTGLLVILYYDLIARCWYLQRLYD